MTVGSRDFIAKPPTKSRLKIALECPTRLYYAARPSEYFDANQTNDFLQSFADGGNQVGELAKYLHHDDPVGASSTVALDYNTAIAETKRRLASPKRVVMSRVGCLICMTWHSMHSSQGWLFPATALKRLAGITRKKMTFGLSAWGPSTIGLAMRPMLLGLCASPLKTAFGQQGQRALNVRAVRWRFEEHPSYSDAYRFKNRRSSCAYPFAS